MKVLGAWAVTDGPTEVSVPPGHLRSLLSVLVLADGQPVRVDTLAEQLWGDQQPANVRGTLSTYVTRLRRLLGSGAITSYPGGGYSLSGAGQTVDLHRFRELLRQAREAQSSDDELDRLTEALGLWRGRPFTGVDCGWLERDIVPGLTEEWFTATERRIDLELARGRSSELIAELWQLTNSYSFRESLWLRLIGALHRAGRRADALAAYRRVHTILRDDLGIDPGAELQRLHQIVLRGDRPAASKGPHQLPPGRARFTGRATDLSALDRMLSTMDRNAIVTIDGPAGMGKTALAVHWAHRIAARYPDVQLYLDLKGYSRDTPVTAAAALKTVLQSLGVPGERIPPQLHERSALLRTTLAGRRTLLLLDNARDAAQVRPLLPGPGSLAIITSRNQLRGLSIKDGAARWTVGRLTQSEALDLLTAGMSVVDTAAATRIVELCDRLPLALAIAAERARSAGSMAEALTDGSLDDFSFGEEDLREALTWSYRMLDPCAAATFRTFNRYTAQARVLDRLVEENLVDHAQGRYEMHRLTRLYAAEGPVQWSVAELLAN
ncbi:BTAD domain-containing putative transcriptional regulator [Actinocrispum sp. NPDC049592]|uniref:AfsR/SARP family transcriptional regulator n=1 Tax=Actinocrispum sp. NPDC049592 TaxID=3154835 RepID=UPI003412E83A